MIINIAYQSMMSFSISKYLKRFYYITLFTETASIDISDNARQLLISGSTADAIAHPGVLNDERHYRVHPETFFNECVVKIG